MHPRLAEAMGKAQAAAEHEFRKAGLEDPVVVVNVAYRDQRMDWCAGSAIPTHPPPMLADSLRQSVSEVEETLDGLPG